MLKFKQQPRHFPEIVAMKSIQRILLCLLACLMACQQPSPPTETSTQPQPEVAPPRSRAPQAERPLRDPADTVDHEQRIPSDLKGNYVWAGATNLAWREMLDSILQGPAQLEGLSPAAQATLGRLNQSEFTKRDLDSSSYYAKAGFGQDAVQEIGREMKRRFPQVKYELDESADRPTRFVAFACIFKALKYENAFGSDTVHFLQKEVAGFSSHSLSNKIRIVEYQSDAHFLIRINLRDTRDELFLCKGYGMADPENALKVIALHRKQELAYPSNEDDFTAPNLHLEFRRSYEELCEHRFLNAGFEDRVLAEMREWIAFDMDGKGVKVVAYTVHTGKDALKGEVVQKPKPKHFFLDQPYWVILKRHDSPRPYFILGVRNAAMMTPIGKK
jgi:hypothetical protein